jgi:tetratricopeptide (TPR) repeat protein
MPWRHFQGNPVQRPTTFSGSSKLTSAVTRLSGKSDTAPDADACYQRGLTHASLGHTAPAIEAFRKATQLEPNMAAAWCELVNLLRENGDSNGADAAYEAQSRALDSGSLRQPVQAQLGSEQLAGLEQYWAKELNELSPQAAGIKLLAALAGDAPLDSVAIRMLAKIVTSDRQKESLLHRALALAPGYAKVRLDLAILLFSQRRNAEALPHFKFLVEQEPEKPVFRASLAVCYGSVGDYQQAIMLYEQCRANFKHDVTFLINYAEALKYSGRRDDSVGVLRGALQNPGIGLAWWALANIKSEPFSPTDMQRMHAVLTDMSSASPERYHLHYALGSAFEQQADYAESFRHYAAGAALKRASIEFDNSQSQEITQRVKNFFSAARLARAPNQGCPDASPIFIVGMPRAGSTLVEQILSSHSKVEGTMELPEVSYIAQAIDRKREDRRYPDALADYGPEALTALGEQYIRRSMTYRRTSKPHFTDKMPSNCAHVGLILMMLPNAKIVDVRRKPMAGCFAAFKQLFGHGVAYSYDFGELAHYYANYIDQMAHFDNLLPGRIHRVHYEHLVNDTEAELRRLLMYCELDYEPACLRHWETARAVSTPSAEQVRRPIFREGLDSWRNYEPWLDPLKQHLIDAGLI